jgi:hypothetical protein
MGEADLGSDLIAAFAGAQSEIEGAVSSASRGGGSRASASTAGGGGAGEDFADLIASLAEAMAASRGGGQGPVLANAGIQGAAPVVNLPPMQPIASPPVVVQPPAMPAPIAASTSTTNITRSYKLDADFSNSNRYPEIRDQFKLLEMAGDL